MTDPFVRMTSIDGARLETNFKDMMEIRRAKIDEDTSALFEGTGKVGDGHADAREIPREWRPKDAPQLLEKLRSTSIDHSLTALKLKKLDANVCGDTQQLQHAESLMEIHELTPSARGSLNFGDFDGSSDSASEEGPKEDFPLLDADELEKLELNDLLYDTKKADSADELEKLELNDTKKADSAPPEDSSSLSIFAAHYYVNGEARRLQAALGISSATAVRLALLHQNAEQELFSSLISGLALFHNPVMARRVLPSGEIRRCIVRLDKDDMVVCDTASQGAANPEGRAQIVPYGRITNVWRNVQNAARGDPRKFVIVRCGRTDVALLFVSSTVARVFSQSLQICRGVGHPLYNLEHSGYAQLNQPKPTVHPASALPPSTSAKRPAPAGHAGGPVRAHHPVPRGVSMPRGGSVSTAAPAAAPPVRSQTTVGSAEGKRHSFRKSISRLVDI